MSLEEKAKEENKKMIDIDALNKFLDESNELIKKSKGLDDIAKGKPLCSFRIDSDGDSLTFSIEARDLTVRENGLTKNVIEFYVAAGHGTDDSSKFISNRRFIVPEERCASFEMSHDESGEMTIQQVVLAAMRDVVVRMSKETQSQFIDGVKWELNGVKATVSFVKSNEDPLEKISESCEAGCSAVGVALGRLNLKGGRLSDEEISERVRKICHPDPVEDTVDSEFARTIGDKEEKPEHGNEIDDAMKGMEVYRIRRKTFGQRIVATFRKAFGLDLEQEKLDAVCAEMFDEKEDN